MPYQNPFWISKIIPYEYESQLEQEEMGTKSRMGGPFSGIGNSFQGFPFGANPMGFWGPEIGNLMGLGKQFGGLTGGFPFGAGMNGLGGFGLGNLMGMAKQFGGLTGSVPFGPGINGFGGSGFGNAGFGYPLGLTGFGNKGIGGLPLGGIVPLGRLLGMGMKMFGRF